MARKDVTRLVEAKLASSGLTAADGRRLGVEELASARALNPRWPDVPALKLVYHDRAGKARRDVYRVRVLAQPKGAFGEESKVRYLQPPQTPPAVYWPRLADWAALAVDPAQRLVITEGELKAASATRIGFPTIGLGGVWSWRSAKLGWELLPELAEVTWARREVVVAFDSDAASNPDVAAATAALTAELAKRGALPRVAVLPSAADGAKQGLDDLIVASGEDAVAVLEALFEEARSDELARRLWEFNGRFAFVLSPGMIVDERLGVKHDPAKFKTAVFANEWATEQVKTDDGVRVAKTQVAPAWVEWPLRRQFAGVTYRPGEPRVLADGRYNEWAGWGVVPAKGDVGPWLRLLDHLFKGAEPEARAWFERWCLYPLRYPGAKLLTACGMWSRTQGVGKSLVGVTLGRVYGPANYQEISQDELEAGFTGWAVNRQLVMVDDVSAADSRAKADRLKKLITQEQLYVNIKYIPEYTVPDCVNYYLTSNRPNAFYLEEQDRRFFVHEVTAPKPAPEFFERYYAWIGRARETVGPGAGALLHYAQETADLGDFKPYLPPPHTRAKQDMIDAVKGELDLWLTELRTDPDAKLRVGQVRLTRDVYSVRELLALFDGERKGPPVTPAQLGLRVRDHLEPACGGQPLRPDGANERLYIARSPERWAKATRAQVEAHVRDGRARDARGGKF